MRDRPLESSSPLQRRDYNVHAGCKSAPSVTNILVVKWRKNKVYAALVVDDASMLEDSPCRLPRRGGTGMEDRRKMEREGGG